MNKEIKVKKISIIMLMSGMVGSISATIEEVYAKFFGGQDASSWYAVTAQKALRDSGHQQPEGIPIKKMNALGPLCTGDSLYSFSMFNMWFDEELLNQVDELERLFVIYHEAAHVTQKHHQQFLFSLIPVGMLAVLVPFMHNRICGTQPAIVRYVSYCVWYMLGAMAVKKWYVQPLIKLQEKYADLAACHTLSAIDRQDVIDAHIALLKLMISLGYDQKSDWHYDLANQVSYLEDYQVKESQCEQLFNE